MNIRTENRPWVLAGVVIATVYVAALIPVYLHVDLVKVDAIYLVLLLPGFIVEAVLAMLFTEQGVHGSVLPQFLINTISAAFYFVLLGRIIKKRMR